MMLYVFLERWRNIWLWVSPTAMVLNREWGKSLTPRRHLAASGDIHGCHNGWGAGTQDIAGISWLEARDAITRYTSHNVQNSLQNKELSISKCWQFRGWENLSCRKKHLKWKNDWTFSTCTKLGLQTATYSLHLNMCSTKLLFTSRWFLYISIYLRMYSTGSEFLPCETLLGHSRQSSQRLHW